MELFKGLLERDQRLETTRRPRRPREGRDDANTSLGGCWQHRLFFRGLEMEYPYNALYILYYVRGSYWTIYWTPFEGPGIICLLDLIIWILLDIIGDV